MNQFIRNSKSLAKNLEDIDKGYVSWPAIWTGAIAASLFGIYYGVGLQQMNSVTRYMSLLALFTGMPFRLLKRKVVPKKPEERGLPVLYIIYFCGFCVDFAVGVIFTYLVLFVGSLFF